MGSSSIGSCGYNKNKSCNIVDILASEHVKHDKHLKHEKLPSDQMS